MHPAGELGNRAREELPYKVVPRSMFAGNQHQNAFGIALQNGAEQNVEVGMKFEQALRTAVNVGIGGEAESGSIFHLRRRDRPVVVGRKGLQADELLRVMLLGSIGLE